MNYKFPTITNISDVLPHIKDRDEIIVAEREHFTVINYLVAFADTFPHPSTATTPEESLSFAMRRECRGLKFHPQTGDIIGRFYHKFFNLNEKIETQTNNINWNLSFIILEKLDGSAIHPIITDTGKIFMCTRMGMTDVAAQADYHIEKSFVDYLPFCRAIIKDGATPIFEWCSKKQRIVLLYPEDQLVLTAIRYNKSGNYLHHKKMFDIAKQYGIPVVNKWEGTFDGIERFVEENKVKTNEEGNVFRFDSGLMLKCKNDWYCEIHRAKDEIRFEKNLIRLHLEGNLDDVIPHLLAEDAVRVEAFVADFDIAVKNTIYQLRDVIEECGSIMNKKSFAAHNIEYYSAPERGILFSIWDGHSATSAVIKAILKKTGSQTQVNSVRSLFGVNWDDY